MFLKFFNENVEPHIRLMTNQEAIHTLRVIPTIDAKSANLLQQKINTLQQRANKQLNDKYGSEKGKKVGELIDAGNEFMVIFDYAQARKYFRAALEKLQKSGRTSGETYKTALESYYGSILMDGNNPDHDRLLNEFMTIYGRDLMMVMAMDAEPEEGDLFDSRIMMLANAGALEMADSLLKASDMGPAEKRANQAIIDGIKTNNKIKKVEEDLLIFEYPNLLDTAVMYIGQRSYDKKANHWIDNSIEQIQPTILNRLGENHQFAILEKLQINAEANLNYITRAVDVHPELAAKAYDQSLRLKGLSLEHQKRIRRLAKEVQSPKVQSLYQQIQELQDRQNAIYASGREGAYGRTEEVRALIYEKARLEEALYQLDEMQFKEALTLEWHDVQKSLKKGEAAVEILRYLHREDGLWTDQVKYVALILKPEDEWPKLVPLPNGNDLEGKHFQTYQNSRNLPYDAESPVFQNYWANIQKHLRGVEQVYFSPDGIYHLINLNTIPNPSTPGKYLVDALSITIVNSTRSIGQPKPVGASTKTAVILGNPSYNMPLKQETGNSDVPVAGNSKKQWSGLPGTKTEINLLESFLRKNNYKTSLYTEENALESTIRNIKSPNILHLATHGFFANIDYSGMLSFMEEDEVGHKYPSVNGIIGLKPQTNLESVFKGDQLDNEWYAKFLDTLSINYLWLKPELNSGLVFAGANSQQPTTQSNDGILYGSEVSLLDLHGTELVVLSACESGQGQLSIIQGISGLKRAFQTAGAENMIISLWKVNDDVTQQFMSLFYQNWIKEGLSKQAAFRKTQQQIRDEHFYEEPRHWGAFVLVKN